MNSRTKKAIFGAIPGTIGLNDHLIDENMESKKWKYELKSQIKSV